MRMRKYFFHTHRYPSRDTDTQISCKHKALRLEGCVCVRRVYRRHILYGVLTEREAESRRVEESQSHRDTHVCNDNNSLTLRATRASRVMRRNISPLLSSLIYSVYVCVCSPRHSSALNASLFIIINLHSLATTHSPARRPPALIV